MRQLTGLDTSFLNMETGSQFGHVASITIFDGKGLKPGEFYARILHLMEERLHLMPVLRRRLVEVPFGLDHPWWIEDPDFDLEFHIRNLALPAPGDDAQLAEQVARLAARPLDRSRPMWEAYVIEGLAGDRVGFLNKVHHCTIDGAQGVEMLMTMLDTDPEGREIAPPKKAWRPEAIPSSTQLLMRAGGNLMASPRMAARLGRKTAQAMVDIGRARGFKGLAEMPSASGLSQIPGIGELLAGASRLAGGRKERAEEFPVLPDKPAPKTSFNRSITAHRRYAFRGLPLADARYVKTVFGTTINDVVMAISAAALRAYLIDRNELPADPLIAMVPVSIRTGNEEDAYSNRVASILAPLHTQIEDPVARLQAIGHSMRAAKEMQKAMPADLMTDLAHFAPPMVAARASRLATRTKVADRMNPPFNVVISNVPGPNVSLFAGGALLQGFFPVSTIVDGQGMNITVQSYKGSLDFGVIGCREVFPDVWSLVDGIEAGLVELVAAARAHEAEAAEAAEAESKALETATSIAANVMAEEAAAAESARPAKARATKPARVAKANTSSAIATVAPRKATTPRKAVGR